MRILIIIALLLTVFSSLPVPVASQTNAETLDLSITLTSVRGNEGAILVAVYDDAGAFNAYGDAAMAFAALPAGADVGVSFHGLAPRPYAVRAFHDQDGDGEMAMEDGSPLEGYATSGASGRFDDPDFDDASTTGSTVELRMFYLN